MLAGVDDDMRVLPLFFDRMMHRRQFDEIGPRRAGAEDDHEAENSRLGLGMGLGLGLLKA